jgi:hypothetical protein
LNENVMKRKGMGSIDRGMLVLQIIREKERKRTEERETISKNLPSRERKREREGEEIGYPHTSGPL